MIPQGKGSRTEKLLNSSQMKTTDIDNSKENFCRFTTKIMNSTKENSNSSLDLIFNRSIKDINFMKNSKINDKPSFLNLPKNILVNEINFIDRRSIRNGNEILNKKKAKLSNASEENIFMSQKVLEREKLLETLKTDFDNVDFNKKIKQHKLQKIIGFKLVQNPNDKKIFQNIATKSNNPSQFYGKRISNFMQSSINILKPTNLRRIMSISPYSTIPNKVKYSWVNNPRLEGIYESKLSASLTDQEGNRFKHVSHGCSTIFFKDKLEKYDLLKNLLDFNVDLPPAFKKTVKIKNIRRIIKLKTSKKKYFFYFLNIFGTIYNNLFI